MCRIRWGQRRIRSVAIRRMKPEGGFYLYFIERVSEYGISLWTICIIDWAYVWVEETENCWELLKKWESRVHRTGTLCRYSKKVPRSREQRRSFTPALSNVSSMKTCYNCSRVGHTAKNFHSSLVSCFKCGQVGHWVVHYDTVAERFEDRVVSAPKGYRQRCLVWVLRIIV